MTATVIIETDRLTKRYGPARGIDELSIAVERGEVYGFLGPNGAGKTTTIRTLLDLEVQLTWWGIRGGSAPEDAAHSRPPDLLIIDALKSGTIGHLLRRGGFRELPRRPRCSLLVLAQPSRRPSGRRDKRFDGRRRDRSAADVATGASGAGLDEVDRLSIPIQTSSVLKTGI